MREIEFKAQMVDDGVWVKGDLIQYGGTKIIHPKFEFSSELVTSKVLPETICQFITLTDKNGTKLYDGDKFQYRKHDGYFLDDFVGVVKFKDGCFGFTVIGEASTGYFVPFSKFDELQEDFLDHIEIIGNIHDKAQQKQAIINMIRLDEELGLYGNK